MPLPATHLQSVQTAVKMATAPDLSLRGGRRPTWQSREGSVDSVPAAVKMGNASDLSLRGGPRPTWQSRSTMVDNRNASANSQAVAGDCTPRALPRASRSGRHVASLLAMTNRGPLPFYRYPIRIGGAAPGAACRSPTAHGRRSVYFSFFIFQSSVFISMRPSPTTHYRFLASGVDFSCASCSARMMRFETSQPRGVRYQRDPLCAARPCPAKRSSSCCSGAKGSR